MDYTITPEVSAALDRIDWRTLSRKTNITRADVENNPKAAWQLAHGKSTDLVEYSIPGIPGTHKAQLQGHMMKDEQSGEYVLSPDVIVRQMNESYQLTAENLVIADIYDSQGKAFRLDPKEHRDIINYLLETQTFTNKETGEEKKSFVCNICPVPLKVQYKEREATFYLGFDARSRRPVAISEEALKGRLVDEEGHSRIQRELFGKGITVSDEMAKALGDGRLCAAIFEKDGKQQATVLAFNIAKGEIVEDHTAAAKVIRQQAYDYIRKMNPAEEAKEEKKQEEQKEEKKEAAKKTARVPKL